VSRWIVPVPLGSGFRSYACTCRDIVEWLVSCTSWRFDFRLSRSEVTLFISLRGYISFVRGSTEPHCVIAGGEKIIELSGPRDVLAGGEGSMLCLHMCVCRAMLGNATIWYRRAMSWGFMAYQGISKGYSGGLGILVL
jgi:hypothetical protein